MQDNNKESPQQPDLNPEQQTTPNRFTSTIRRRLFKAARSLDETFAITNERIPVDQIDEYAVTRAINITNYNSLRERAGQNPRSPFDVTDALKGLGYQAINPFERTGYQRLYPQAYSRTRISLYELKNRGVLDFHILDHTNFNGEDMIFEITDEEKFKECLKEGEQKRAQDKPNF